MANYKFKKHIDYVLTLCRDLMIRPDTKFTSEQCDDMEEMLDIMKNRLSQKTSSSEKTIVAESSITDVSAPTGLSQNELRSYHQMLENANMPRFNHSAFLTPEKTYLHLKKLPSPFLGEDVESKKSTYMLGVVYDHIRKDWIVCDFSGKLFRFLETDDSNEQTWTLLTNPKVQNPIAIVILKEGESFAILCSKTKWSEFYVLKCTLRSTGEFSTEYLFSYRLSQFNLDHPCRGLAKSVSGNFMTVELLKGAFSPRLRILIDSQKDITFELKGSFQPSFIDSYNNRVALSDIYTKKVWLLKVDDSSLSKLKTNLQNCIQVLRVIENTLDVSKLSLKEKVNTSFLKCPAGVKFDRDGNLFVADSGSHTIKVFENNLDFSHRISTNFSIPIMSNFFINSSGKMLILQLHDRPHILFAQIEAEEYQTKLLMDSQ